MIAGLKAHHAVQKNPMLGYILFPDSPCPNCPGRRIHRLHCSRSLGRAPVVVMPKDRAGRFLHDVFFEMIARLRARRYLRVPVAS